MQADITKYEHITAVTVYENSDSVNKLIGMITKEAREIESDISTYKGRELIASTAHKVARLKIYFDGLGKDLVTGWKAQAKVVDVERKKIRDSLDELKIEVRGPLTEWENAEQKRIDTIRARIQAIANAGLEFDENEQERNDAMLKQNLQRIKSTEIDETFQEYTKEAAVEKDKAVRYLEGLIEKRDKAARDTAELERLRAEKAEQEQIAHEEKIKVEAAEKARKEAELKAEAEKKQLEQKTREAVAAKEKAELETELATKRERERIETEQRAQIAEEQKRAENIKYRERIIIDAVDAIVESSGIDKTMALVIFNAIDAGKIPHVIVRY